MIHCEFAFNGGRAFDSYDRYKFIYVDSDDTMHAPKKEESDTFLPDGSVLSSDRYVEDAFDYHIRFVSTAKNVGTNNANRYINLFVSDAHNGEDLKEITYTNAYKGVKIVGKYKNIEEKSFYRKPGQDDCVQLELTLRVTEPSKCDFDYDTD